MRKYEGLGHLYSRGRKVEGLGNNLNEKNDFKSTQPTFVPTVEIDRFKSGLVGSTGPLPNRPNW